MRDFGQEEQAPEVNSGACSLSRLHNRTYHSLLPLNTFDVFLEICLGGLDVNHGSVQAVVAHDLRQAVEWDFFSHYISKPVPQIMSAEALDVGYLHILLDHIADPSFGESVPGPLGWEKVSSSLASCKVFFECCPGGSVKRHLPVLFPFSSPYYQVATLGADADVLCQEIAYFHLPEAGMEHEHYYCVIPEISLLGSCGHQGGLFFVSHLPGTCLLLGDQPDWLRRVEGRVAIVEGPLEEPFERDQPSVDCSRLEFSFILHPLSISGQCRYGHVLDSELLAGFFQPLGEVS